MWPTEYMVHEHGKELRRVAAQVTLVREATNRENARQPRFQWVATLFRLIRRPRPAVTVEHAGQSKPVVLGRVN